MQMRAAASASLTLKVNRRLLGQSYVMCHVHCQCQGIIIIIWIYILVRSIFKFIFPQFFSFHCGYVQCVQFAFIYDDPGTYNIRIPVDLGRTMSHEPLLSSFFFYYFFFLILIIECRWGKIFSHHLAVCMCAQVTMRKIERDRWEVWLRAWNVSFLWSQIWNFNFKFSPQKVQEIKRLLTCQNFKIIKDQ